MADELNNETLEERTARLEQEVEASRAEAQRARQELDQANKTWEGRTQQAQRALDTARQSVAPNGWTFDDAGNPVQLVDQSGQHATTQQPAVDDDGMLDEPMTKREIMELVRQAAAVAADQGFQRAVQYAAPQFERSADRAAKTLYSDWDEIGSEVTNLVKGQGFTGIADCEQRNPAYLEQAVKNVRYDRIMANGGPDAAATRERERQAALDAGATVGSGATQQVQSSVEITDADRENAKRLNMKPDEYMDALDRHEVTVRPKRKEGN